MKYTSRSALFLLTLLAIFLTGFSSQEEKPWKATWLWQTSLITTEPDQILSFAKDQGVNMLYLQIDTTKSPAYYQSFVKRAREAGIEVHALGGQSSWVLEENRKRVQALVNWVIQYNQTVSDSEKLVGIHLDIEPYLLPEWKTNKDAIIQQWMETVEAYVEQMKQAPTVEVSCDMPFWLDSTPLPNDPTTMLSEWLISQHDHVTIMAYRDHAEGPNSISSLVPQELGIADALGKKIVIGVETKQSSEGDFVSFYEEGNSYMNSELSKLPALLSSHPSFAGTAVHSYEHWKILKN
jgi:hypothetical protein